MSTRRMWGYLGAWAAVCAGAAPALAAEDLATEVAALRQRVAVLERQLAGQSDGGYAADRVRVPSGTPVELSGFVDTAYTYNFDEPRDQANDGRIFDVVANSFVIHNAELSVEKGVDADSRVGFKTVLMFGDDAELTHSTGLFAGTDSVDLQQAYVEYLAPLGEGVDVTFGKLATLIGAEVIESKDNWNYSRSFLFGKAIPFTHTRVRASYTLSEELTLTGGVNNGWDVANDTNIGKGIEGQLAWSPGDEVSVVVNGMYSPEGVTTAGGALVNNHAKRWIADVVAAWQATDDLAFMLNYDYGFQEDGGFSGVTGEHASWQGVALYSKYQVADNWSLAGRYEFFKDADGSRAGTAFSSGALRDVALQEVTLTSEHQVNEHLIARVEYRHDIADSKAFGADSTSLRNYQDTVAVEMIAPF